MRFRPDILYPDPGGVTLADSCNTFSIYLEWRSAVYSTVMRRWACSCYSMSTYVLVNVECGYDQGVKEENESQIGLSIPICIEMERTFRSSRPGLKELAVSDRHAFLWVDALAQIGDGAGDRLC